MTFSWGLKRKKMTSRITWDCHTHVIGDQKQFPLSPDRGYDPPEAPVSSLLKHLDKLEILNSVIVQPSIYGFDNSYLLDTLERHRERLVGVAVPAPESDELTLEKMHKAGVRGIRCNLINPGGLTLEQTRIWWSWMIEHGWHLQLQIDVTGDQLNQFLKLAPPVPVIIDHFGYPPLGWEHKDMNPFYNAFNEGKAYVKLSAPYRISAKSAPHKDTIHIASRLLSLRPDRCLWGSDWPHTEWTGPAVDDIEWRNIVSNLAGSDVREMEIAANKIYQSR